MFLTIINMQSNLALSAWLSSFRLQTLPLALSSVVLGNALAYKQQYFSWSIFLLTIITAALLQILSNLANDYGDGLKKSDDSGRIGPKRGLHKGEITFKQLYVALIINTILCVGFGLGLIILACDNIMQLVGFIVIGLFAIIAAITYTIGKKPYGYSGFGDISVLIFFGLVSILGSFYLQTKFINSWLLLPALSCGLLSVAVLNINNLRDYDNDKKNHKKTFAVILGYQLTKYYHIIILTLTFILLSIFSLTYLKSIYSWLFLLALPLLFRHIYAVYYAVNAFDFSKQFYSMIKLAFLVTSFYIIGIILS